MYKTAGGLHGVGSSVVNALSDSLLCEVYRDHKIYQSKFAHGGEIIQHLTEIGNTNKKGTFIKFHPDPAIFGNLQFNSSTIKERLLESAFLFNGLKIIFIDENNNSKEEFEAKNNLADFVSYINHSKRTLSPIISYNGSINNISVSISFQYTDNLNEIIVSFANSIKTIEGGSHENGFKTWVSIEPYPTPNIINQNLQDILESISFFV